MKKNALSLAVATGVTALSMATAHAQLAPMYVNHDGTGEVLLFPFYDAENGNATNFHVVNTMDEVKVVKVRFLEYKSSFEVLDFNLFLSPHDHFAFGVVMNQAGTGGSIVTQDNSCTVPRLGTPNNGLDGTTTPNADGSVTRQQPFVNFEFVRGKFVDQDLARTLRGHVEIIEMGVVTDTVPLVAGAPTPTEQGQQLATWATHGADGVPANCAGLEAAYTEGAWDIAGLDFNVAAPSGGLYGLAYHINVEDAAAYGFEPAAIDNWADGSNIHSNPGTIEPNLSSSANTGAVIQESTELLGFGIGIEFESALDAVSGLFMTSTISNDVMLNSAIGGQTDWITTFPTKRQYVTTALGGIEDGTRPFTSGYFGITRNAADTAFIEVQACEPLTFRSWDREEQTTGGAGAGFSPPPVQGDGDEICNEQHVVAWGAGSESALNVERDLVNLSFPYTEGWARWSFDDAGHFLPFGDDSGAALLGLPAQGFAAYKYANGSAGSVMMNYGHVADHKTNTVISLD